MRNRKRATEDAWSKEDLVEALTQIEDKELTVDQAARFYGVSKATLYRHRKLIKGGRSLSFIQPCGPKPVLSKVEEQVLEKTIIDLRGKGYLVTKGDIKKICFEYCLSNGITNKFNEEKREAGDDWYYAFLKRNPGVDNRPGKNMVEEITNDEDETDDGKPESKLHSKLKQCFLEKRKYGVFDNVNVDEECGTKKRKVQHDKSKMESLENYEKNEDD